MLYTLGLVLLLTPYPSLQTTANEKRDSTGIDMSKPNATLTLSKPKTTAALAKQNLHSTLRANKDNQTILTILSSCQKPTVNMPKTTKVKPVPTAIQPTLSKSTKTKAASGTITFKDKLTVSINKTVLIKSHSTSDVKTKPLSNIQKVQSLSTMPSTPSGIQINKVKPISFSNHTVLKKPPSVSIVKTIKDQAVSAVAQNVQSTTKPATHSGVKLTKEKSPASSNQTVATKTASTSDVKIAKHKPSSSANQTAATKTASTSDLKIAKHKPSSSANQTVATITASTSDVKIAKHKPSSSVNQTAATKTASTGDVKIAKEKPSSSANQTAATKTASTSDVKIVKEKPSSSANQTAVTKTALTSDVKIVKEKPSSSANQTAVTKTALTSDVKIAKEKPSSATKTAATKTASTSDVKIAKEKPSSSANQTVATKTASTSDVKIANDKPSSSATQTVATKTDSNSDVKIVKEKPSSSANQTVATKTASTSDVKIVKDKPSSSATQTGATKTASTRDVKIVKEKPSSSANQTVATKTASTSDVKIVKDKPSSSANQTVATKTASTSDVKIVKDKPSSSANQTVATKTASTRDVKIAKEKPSSSANQTVATKTDSNSDVKIAKEKPSSANQTVATKTASTSDVKIVKDKPSSSANQTVATKTASTSATLKNNTTFIPTGTILHHSAGDVETTGNNMVLSTTPISSTNNKDDPTASVNQTTELQPSTSSSVKTIKAKDEASQSNKLVLSNDCESEGELTVMIKPGPAVVMTHQISLVPGGCTGRCVTEMAALQGRVARLEKEMSSLKENCPCSANCPNDCSGNGKCEKGKCVCLQGFLGPDCKNAKGKVTMNVQVTQNSTTTNEKMHEKNTNAETTVFLKKDLKVRNESKESETKAKTSPFLKVGALKPSVKQDKGSASVKITSPPTVGQILLGQIKRKQEEARKGTMTVVTPKDHLFKTDTKQEKGNNKHTQLKDQPQTNVTHGTVKIFNGTAYVQVTQNVEETSSYRTGTNGTLEQSTLPRKNITQSFAKKLSKVKEVPVIPPVDSTKTKEGKSGEGNVPQRSVETVKVNTEEKASDESKTLVHSSGSTGRMEGGSGLGSVKVANITSYTFTLTWSAPQGMFKNFTVIRREYRADVAEDGDEDIEEDATAKNTTLQPQSDNTNGPTKVHGTSGRADSKRVSMVLPGNVRSVQFSNLLSLTRYTLHIYGSAPGKRSKIHRVTVTTGPEPATELVFSNVTESSLTVSWSKPKSTLSGFRVTYTHIVTGESNVVTVDSQESHVVLSKLSTGSSFIVSVTTIKGKAESDALRSTITTVPAPPTHLQAINITDTRAFLQWIPSPGTVDRFIISYESSKTPNVTVTVMVSGNSVGHHLRGLHRDTLYTINVLSQKGIVKSTAISTSFTTANVVKASEVGARSALITWKAPTVAYHSYRLTYQVAGGETKEAILDSTETEYKLTGLSAMTKYIVLVQGERDGHYTSIVTTQFVTGNLHFPFPSECSQELLNGLLHSGEVDIFPYGKDGGAIRVYCDMETDGGGWTVFQRRMNGKVDFYRTWNEYAAGFGNLSNEFWLGNELLHNLTNMAPVSLRVDLRAGNDTAYAHYQNFTIDAEGKHYTITLSDYTGTAGDSMKYHNGRPFSTQDKNPDPLGINCARNYMGGWWYKNCYKTNLNGLYGKNSNNQGVVWIDWKGKDSSIPFTEMKFRPAAFFPATQG